MFCFDNTVKYEYNLRILQITIALLSSLFGKRNVP